MAGVFFLTGGVLVRGPFSCTAAAVVLLAPAAALLASLSRLKRSRLTGSAGPVHTGVCVSTEQRRPLTFGTKSLLEISS